MKAYTYIEKGRFEMLDKPKPEILDSKDAIVRVTLSSICSSDLHIKHGSVPRAVPGITVAHEMVGIVEDVDPDVKVIGIDEAQFFDESIVEVVRTLANRGVRVIIAGLDTDFLAQPFGPMPALMAIAEDVQKVHAICVKCGALANHSHRLSKSDELVVLGEKDIYEPLCRECYNLAIQK